MTKTVSDLSTKLSVDLALESLKEGQKQIDEALSTLYDVFEGVDGSDVWTFLDVIEAGMDGSVGAAKAAVRLRAWQRGKSG